MRRDTTAIILDKWEVAPQHIWMRLSCSWCGRDVRPGQFLHLQLPEADTPLLRRPYTIYRARGDSLEILFQVIGQGTELLADRQVGDDVRVLAPLGVGFPMPPLDATAVIVAGGVGIASLYLLVERLVEARISTRVLFGSRSRAYLLCCDDLAALGVAPDIATVDGSEGYHGLVTELACRVLDEESPPRPHVYACGPTPMMAALADLTLDRGIPTQVALENRMGCGLGVCLGCVVPVVSDDGPAFERVCTEGPVFDARRVRWEYRV